MANVEAALLLDARLEEIVWPFVDVLINPSRTDEKSLLGQLINEKGYEAVFESITDPNFFFYCKLLLSRTKRTK